MTRHMCNFLNSIRFLALLSILNVVGFTPIGAQGQRTIVTSAPLVGSAIQMNKTITLQDPDAGCIPGINWDCDKYTDCYYKSYVRFGIDPLVDQSHLYDGQTNTIEVEYSVIYVDTNDVFQVLPDQTLRVEYNSSGEVTQDQHVQILDGGRHVHLTVVGITATPDAHIPASVYLQLEMEFDRFEDMDINATSDVSTVQFVNSLGIPVANGPFVSFRWPNGLGVETPGVEAYELEWTWVDDELASGIDSDYDFRTNSTRILTTETSYTISNIYRKGILLARVRRIGRTDCDQRVEGAWSLPATGSINCNQMHDYMLCLDQSDAHLEAFNWQHSRTYAEGSKQKDLITYFDGSMRSRQTVTRIESDENALIAETFYDHVGRPAVQALPAPNILGTALFDYSRDVQFYPSFNLENIEIDPNPYSLNNFEVNTGDCSSPAQSLGNFGAGAYYDPANPHQDDFQAYVPDAGGYPISHTIYTQDGTNRVRFQGGVGSDHQIGSDHETKYYYAKPAQKEIDRLFGNEVGYAEYYSKNMVVDPNGQASISYLDNKDRIIATALAGESPTSLTPLDNSANTTESIQDILIGSSGASGENRLDLEAGTLTMLSKFLVPGDNTMYGWDYYYTQNRFFDACAVEICFDCMYESKVTVLDDCNNIVAGDTKFVKPEGAQSIDINCPDNDIIDQRDFNAELDQGGYALSKQLRLRRDVQDAYEELYVANYICAETITDIVDRLLQDVEFGGCVDAVCATDCIADIDLSLYADDIDGYRIALLECLEDCDEIELFRPTCESIRRAMLADLTPGGQYAQYRFDDEGQIVVPDELAISVLNTTTMGCLPGGNYTTINDFGGISVELNGETFSPNELSPEQFVTLYEESWIEHLLPLHPESAYLDHCEANLVASYQYDEDIQKTESFTDAETSGYLNPLGENPGTIGSSYNIGSGGIVDPFFQSGNPGSGQVTTMRTSMLQFQELVEGSGVWYSIWDISYLLSLGQILDIGAMLNAGTLPAPGTFADPNVFGDLICQDDRFWQYFRSLYAGLKRTYVDGSYNFQNACIGSGITPAGGGDCGNCDALTDEDVIRHFYASTDNVLSDIPTDWNDYNAQHMTDEADRCSSICSSYKEQWRRELSACLDAMPAMEIEILLNEMVIICSTGCDVDHPYGASSTPPFETTPNGNANFGDALITAIQSVDPSAEFDAICNPYLISNPFPYGNDILAGQDFTIDDCACERYNHIYDEFEATNPVNNDLDGFHSWLVDNYSIEYGPEEIVNLDCACRTIDSDYKLNEPFNQQTIPPPFACTSCIDCDQMVNAYHAFLDSDANYYGTVSVDQIEDADFRNTMTGWLNQQLGFNLTFHEYREFMAYCGIPFDGSPPGGTVIPPTNPGNGDPDSTTIGGFLFTMEYIPGNGGTPQPGSIIRYRYRIERLQGLTLTTYFSSSLPSGWSFIDPGATIAGGAVSIGPANQITINSFTPEMGNPIQFDLEVKISPDLNLERIYYSRAILSIPLEDVVYSDDPSTPNIQDDPTGVFVETADPCQGNVENTTDFLDFMNYLIADNSLNSNTSIDISQADEFVLSSLNLWGIQPGVGSLLRIEENMGLFSFIIENTCGNQALPLCNFTLEGVNNLQDIAEFISVEPLTYNDNDMNHNFEVDIVLTNGVETTLLGSSDCYSWIPCERRTLCNRSVYDIDEPPIETDCVNDIVDLAIQQAQLIHETEINDARERFRVEYPKKCLKNLQENLTQDYDLKEYHYTLYYYDQSGNLIRTIPPKGVQVVDLDDDDDMDGIANGQEIVDFRQGVSSEPFDPAHTFVTHYQQDSYNNTLISESPDADYVQMWYDNLGRVVVSQDGRQREFSSPFGPPYTYSYTIYDEQSRIIEVGEMSTSTVFSDILLNNPQAYIDWLNAPNGNRRYVTRTIYDENFIANPINVDEYFGSGYERRYLRKRVSSSLFYNHYTLSDPDGYNYASHYDYDVHGNVKTLIQEFAPLKSIDQHLKRIDYYYDLVSGNVNEVWYQHDESDALYHRYTYDADNRITEVETSHDYIIWDKDAEYQYYVHGPLARSELGEHKVQGCDYAYTIHGWIKGVNSNTLNEDRDIGLDGKQNVSGNPNANHAADVYGYTLGYYTGDYTGISGNNSFIADENGTAFNELYNGNISRMVTALKDVQHDVVEITPNAYTYDQLHRIKEMQKFKPIDVGTNSWDNMTTPAYHTDYSYDPNGNLMTLNRQDKNDLIDELTYDYEPTTNRLDYIKDNVTGHAHSIQDQVSNNYEYDGSGNLTKDASEEIDVIKWDNYGKIREVSRDGAATPAKPDVFYHYDAMGNRVAKLVKRGPDLQDWEGTYYIRDAQGNIMATYRADGFNTSLLPQELYPREHHVYGSSRLGIKNADDPELELGSYVAPVTDKTAHLIGKRNYELSNHLGNVLSVVSDNKLLNRTPGNNNDPIYRAEILQYSDYYPFGWEMPGRNGSLSGEDSYRFGFNGKEKDRDLTGNESLLALDYGFRIYNPAIGRFLSVDPLTKSYPWYTPYQFAGNKPIMAVDLDGLEEQNVNPPLFHPPEDITEGHTWFSSAFDALQSAPIKSTDKGYGPIQSDKFTLNVTTTKDNFEKLKQIYKTDPGIVQDNFLADYEPFQNPNSLNSELEVGEGMIIDVFGNFNAIVKFTNIESSENSFSVSAVIVDPGIGTWFSKNYNHPDAGHITFSGKFNEETGSTVFTIEHETSIGNFPVYLFEILTMETEDGIGLARFGQALQWRIVMENVEEVLDPEKPGILTRYSKSTGKLFGP